MSKDKDQPRSRRELRAAAPEHASHDAGTSDVTAVPVATPPHDERHGRRTSVAPTNAPDPAPEAAPAVPRPHGTAAVPAAAESPAAATSPAAAIAPVRERSSQTRARDRAALRAYKDLLEPGTASGNPLPSRRALRQAQLDAERAPITSVNPVVPAAAEPAPATQAEPAPPSAAEPAPATQAKSAESPVLPEAVTPTVPAAVPAEPEAAPQSAQPAAPTTGMLRSRAGRRAAPGQVDRVTTPPAETPVAETPGPDSPTAAEAPAVAGLAAEPAAVSEPGAEPTAASLAADALAANYPPIEGLIPGGNYHPISAGPPQTPSSAELAALAEQRAQAERSAILKQRAQVKERLAQESAKSRRPASDPTATNNLAMVTPLEFVEVPGVDRPVLRPPATTHIPIITRPSAAQDAMARAQAERFDAALAARAVTRPAVDARPLSGDRSSTLKRAAEMVADAPESAEPNAAARTQMPPMPAEYAHGLEPLDAMTAGLGRTQRNLLVQWGSIILGGAALIASAVVIITGLGR